MNLNRNKDEFIPRKKRPNWFRAYQDIKLPEARAFFRLSFILKKMNYQHRKIFKKFKITTSQYHTLSVINNFKEGSISINKIKEYLVIMNADITRIVDKLEKKGYVFRRRTKKDRRIVWIKITESGIELVNQIRLLIDESHRKNFSSLNEDELVTLNGLLLRLENINHSP